MRRFPVGTVVLLGACATTSTSIPVQYQVADNPDRGSLVLSYTNLTGQPVCLSAEVWPNRFGWFSHEGNRILIGVGSQRFPMRENNVGYCPGGCATRVARGEALTGFIPYERFDLPQHLWTEPKQLEFDPPPAAFSC